MPNEGRERPATALEEQVDLVTEALHPKDIGVAPPDWRRRGTIDYMYERGAILLRDRDEPRVRELLGGGRPRGDEDEVNGINGINGLTVFSLEGVDRQDTSVPVILEELDRRLGVGVATPNHVVSITPGGTLCPATEPEEPHTTDPDPGVCPGEPGGSGVRVSVLDTGLLANAAAGHPWLAGVKGGIENPVDGGNVILPYAGHGTFIAGVLRCMAPHADVFVHRAFARGGALTESDIVLQLVRSLRRSPDVISLSAGTQTREVLPLLGFEVFGERLREHKGVVLVAAAGNDGNRGPFWPAAFPWAVSVGALAANWRTRAHFSNHGGWVDVYAPGEGLVNAYARGLFVCREPPHRGERRIFNGMARWSGTSFATPLVAGLIANRMSRTGENGRQAARRLLAMARSQALPGLGAVLLPCDDCGQPRDHHGHGHPCKHPCKGC